MRNGIIAVLVGRKSNCFVVTPVAEERLRDEERAVDEDHEPASRGP